MRIHLREAGFIVEPPVKNQGKGAAMMRRGDGWARRSVRPGILHKVQFRPRQRRRIPGPISLDIGVNCRYFTFPPWEFLN